jgi:hypothetical protein
VLLRYSRNLWTVIRISLAPDGRSPGCSARRWSSYCPGRACAQIAQVDGLLPNAAVLVLVAVFGTLLPVPIAFDVVVCAVLWNAGVPTYVVATLLVTLGIYSVYPWSLVGTTLSWRVAAVAGAAVMTLGIVAGGVAGLASRWQDIRTIQRRRACWRPSGSLLRRRCFLPPGRSAAGARGARAAVRRRRGSRRTEPRAVGRAVRPGRAGASAKAFTRIEGAQIGLDRLPMPRPYQVMQPGPMHIGGLAAGDVNGDGWQDLVVGHELRRAPLRQRRRALRAAGGGLPGDARLDDLRRRARGPGR